MIHTIIKRKENNLLLKLTVLVLLLCMLPQSGITQIEYEEGYFIDNTGSKKACLIRYEDWKLNPSQFTYKLHIDEEPQKGDLATVQEFGRIGDFKYIRKKVKVDQSSEIISKLSTKRNAEFEEATVFLKVLIEGNASLYTLENMNRRFYFYATDNRPIEQLVHKQYKTRDDKIGTNNYFRQQLGNAFNCSNPSKKEIDRTKYKQGSMLRLFRKYNTCKDADVTDYIVNVHRDVFNLNIRPRLRLSSLSINNSIVNERDTDFGNFTAFSLGLEGEYILPFNKNKWSLIVEPIYQQLKASKTQSSQRGYNLTTDLKYTSVEIPIGGRHYIFLKDNSKLFINAAWVVDLPFASSVMFKRFGNQALAGDLEITSRNNILVGAGYKRNRLSVELRYQTNRELFRDFYYWYSNHRILSLIIGYSLLSF